MEDSVKKTGFLHKIFKKIRSAYKHPVSKEVRIFLVFFLLSFFFWGLQSLQEVREVSLRIPIKYTELSTTLSVTNDLPTYLTVTLSDKGTNLYSYYRHRKDLTLHVNVLDYYNKQDVSEIPLAEMESMIRKKVLNSTQVLRINPERIKLYFARKQAVEVPIRLISTLSFTPQHQLSDTPRINPKSVKVFAPASLIGKIKFVETEVLKLADLKDTTEVSVALKPIPGLRFATNTINVSLFVEEYTERSFTIPVIASGFPEGSALLAFPSKVTVTFFIGLSAYNSIKASDFEAVVRYSELMSSSSNQCVVHLTQVPARVQNLRIQPAKVECLIEKNR